MTGQIQSQLDQVLSLAAQNVSADDMEFTVAAANFLREHGPAIRAAVGGVGETVAWWREDHVCHAHELTAANALADGYKPCVIKCEDCAWNASLCDTHGAVGGEAVDHVQVFEVADSERGDFHNNQCAWSSIGVYLPIGTKLYLHASPPATVDVGALPEPEGEMKWTRSAGVCIQPEPGYTAEQMREYRLSGGVSADALRQYISGLRLVQKVNENDGTERSNGKAFAFGVVANELAALIGKEA